MKNTSTKSKTSKLTKSIFTVTKVHPTLKSIFSSLQTSSKNTAINFSSTHKPNWKLRVRTNDSEVNSIDQTALATKFLNTVSRASSKITQKSTTNVQHSTPKHRPHLNIRVNDSEVSYTNKTNAVSSSKRSKFTNSVFTTTRRSSTSKAPITNKSKSTTNIQRSAHKQHLRIKTNDSEINYTDKEKSTTNLSNIVSQTSPASKLTTNNLPASTINAKPPSPSIKTKISTHKPSNNLRVKTNDSEVNYNDQENTSTKFSSNKSIDLPLTGTQTSPTSQQTNSISTHKKIYTSKSTILKSNTLTTTNQPSI